MMCGICGDALRILDSVTCLRCTAVFHRQCLMPTRALSHVFTVPHCPRCVEGFGGSNTELARDLVREYMELAHSGLAPSTEQAYSKKLARIVGYVCTRLGVPEEAVLPVGRAFDPDLAIKYMGLRRRDGVTAGTVLAEVAIWGALLR